MWFQTFLAQRGRKSDTFILTDVKRLLKLENEIVNKAKKKNPIAIRWHDNHENEWQNFPYVTDG